MKKSDINEIRYRRLLINSFINKIYLWDAKVIVSFNTNKSDTTKNIPVAKELQCSFEVSNASPKKFKANSYYLREFAV